MPYEALEYLRTVDMGGHVFRPRNQNTCPWVNQTVRSVRDAAVVAASYANDPGPVLADALMAVALYVPNGDARFAALACVTARAGMRS